MKIKVIPKKVELTELFYDLVFVYAISKVTGLIDELPTNGNFLQPLLTFSIVMIVFINTWMVETVFTNRYGRNSLGNIMFFMIDMAIVLFMSNNFVGNIYSWFKPFAIATGLLSGTLVLQYLGVFLKSHNQNDRTISKLFICILSLRTICLLLGGFLPLKSGLIVALIGILSSWILPGIYTSRMKSHPINFPHLLERLTSLIIISFGETIVDIAHYFDPKSFQIESIFIFMIVCALFMTYITQFDHFIEENKINETGNRLIYLHYPILFGISLTTVSLSFIQEAHFPKTLAINSLYSGIILFYLGIFLADYYNKSTLTKGSYVPIVFAITTFVGLLGSFFIRTFNGIILITLLVTIINATILSYNMVHQQK